MAPVQEEGVGVGGKVRKAGQSGTSAVRRAVGAGAAGGALGNSRCRCS